MPEEVKTEEVAGGGGRSGCREHWELFMDIATFFQEGWEAIEKFQAGEDLIRSPFCRGHCSCWMESGLEDTGVGAGDDVGVLAVLQTSGSIDTG